MKIGIWKKYKYIRSDLTTPSNLFLYTVVFTFPRTGKLKDLVVNHGDLPAKNTGLSTERLTFSFRVDWGTPSPPKGDRLWLFGLNISFAPIRSYELTLSSSFVDPLLG